MSGRLTSGKIRANRKGRSAKAARKRGKTMMNTTMDEDITIKLARQLGLDGLIEIIGRLDAEVTRLDKERDNLATRLEAIERNQ